MKIKIYSDLHLEFHSHIPKYLLNDNCDVLVLAGDIDSHRNIDYTLRTFAEAYKKVVFVPGNHEFYGTELHAIDSNGVEVLQPGVFTYLGVTFIGATLWSDFGSARIAELGPIASGINDFRLIHGFNLQACRTIHRKEFKFIQDASIRYPGKKVIITHFLPSYACISPRYIGSPANAYFATEHREFIESLEDTLWIYGHTHDSGDFYINKTRMICNPYGYHCRETNSDFNHNLIIEV